MASDYQHVEVNCQRAISGGNFQAGLQDFVFSIGRPSCFIPSKSYFRVELKLTGPDEITAPTISNQVALAENCVANMYNNAYFLAGGQSVSQVTNYLPQAAALEYRTSTSNAWLKSVGQSAFTYNPNLSSRISAVSTDSAPAAFSQDEGKDVTYRPTVGAAGTFQTASIAIVGASGVITQTAGAAITAADYGSTLVLKGVKYTLGEVAGPGGAVPGVISAGPLDVATSPDWYLVRRAAKATDASLEGKNSIYVIWKPSVMGIFNHPGVLGSGDYRIQLNPSSDFRTSAVETLNPDYPTVANSYAFTVQNVVFYAAVAKMELPDVIEQLRLTEFAVLTKNITGAAGNQFQFTVPPSTKSIYIAIQAGDSGSNPAHPPGRFIVGNGQELNLTGLQVTYANQTKPMTRWLSGFAADGSGSNKNFMTQAYYQTAVEGGRAMMAGGIESEADWLSRGPFMCFRFDKDFSDRSTEVQVLIDYGTPAAPGWLTTAKLLLIAEYTNRVDITTQGGLVVSVDKVASA
jgi:hypothetical protein